MNLVSYKKIEKYIPEMERRGVSEVARSSRGFLSYYSKSPTKLSPEWKLKRENFIKRHLAKALKDGEDLTLYSDPAKCSRRTLALLAWAFKYSG